MQAAPNADSKARLKICRMVDVVDTCFSRFIVTGRKNSRLNIIKKNIKTYKVKTMLTPLISVNLGVKLAPIQRG